MKRLFVYCLLLLSVPSVFGQSAKFYEHVLSYEDGRSNYFVPVPVRSDAFSGIAVVESYALLDYLKATRKIDGSTYVAYLLGLQNKNAYVDISDATIDQSGYFLIGKNLKKGSFRVVKSSPAFEDVARHGCEELVRHYFAPPIVIPNATATSSCRQSVMLFGKDLFIRPRYDLSEQNNVILALFRFEIPVHVDDISGSLKIAYSTLRYISAVVTTPQTIAGGPLCEYELNKEMSAFRSKDNERIKLGRRIDKQTSLSSDAEKWLQTADTKKLSAFELRHGDQKALLLSSRNVESTGLASNFEYWFIAMDNGSVEFKSLSKNPQLIFWDDQNLLNYYVIDYSEEFVEDQDFDDLRLDLKHYKVSSDGKSMLIDQKTNIRCE